jgi:hypothetical protein
MSLRPSTTIVCVLLLAAASPAIAEEIRVSARIQRPFWLNGTTRDRTMQSTLNWGPAAHQMVRVYMPRRAAGNVVGKIYCGTVWTDSNGEFDEDLVCGDGNLPNQLYLEVWGHSARGFSVGAFDRVKFDLEMIALAGAAALGTLFVTVGTFGAGAIAAAAAATGIGADAMLNLLDRSPSPYIWVSAVQNVSGNRYAFPSPFRLGRGRTGRAANSDDYAGAVMEGVDYAHAELLSPLPGGVPRFPTWGWSYWIINNPYFGAPTTIWNKVHINPGVTQRANLTFAQNLDASWGQNMGALVHELGHVVYNHGHSNKDHYLDPNEALHYAQVHENCATQISAKFAQYEGFAEAVSQVVWRDPVYSVAAPGNCAAQTGFTTEGNVADFYAAMIHGFGNLRGATLHDYFPVKQGANDAILPPLDALLDMPRAAGPASHSLANMWDNYWRRLCDQPPAGTAPLLCGTERFRCWVATTSQLAPTSQLPVAFQGLSCGPEAVSDVAITTTAAKAASSANDVRFEGVDHAESYNVQIRRPPGGAVVTSREPTDPWATGIPLKPCDPHSVRVSAVNTFATTAGADVEFIPGTHAVCGPGGPSVLSAVHTHDAADLLEARLEAMEILRPADDHTETEAPGFDRERGRETAGAHGAESAAATPATIEDQLTQLLSGGERCYRIELVAAPRADRYAIRYRKEADAAGDETASLIIPDRVHVVCLGGGQRYVINGVGYNDYGDTPGPDYKLTVPHRLEVAQVRGRVIPRVLR